MPPNSNTSRRTDHNGWFEVDANPISKVGVFYYSGKFISPELDADKPYPVFRPPEELADPACIESFKLLPWTNDHPNRLLGAAADSGVAPEDKGIEGIIGEKVFFDPADGMLKANIKVFSRRHADLINSGKKELSAGYQCKYEYAPGEWQGTPYEFVQRQIRGNHLASVSSGRMGPDVAVMDGFRFTIDSSEWRHMKKTNKIRKVMNEVIRFAQDAEETGGQGGDEIKQLCELLKKVAPLMEQISALPAIMARPELAEEVTGDEDDPAADPLAAMAAQTDEEELKAKEEEEAKKKEEEGKSAMDAMESIKKTLSGIEAEIAAIKAGQPKPAAAMDAKEMMVQISKRDALARSLWPFIGVFDHAEMTLDEVAGYGVKKLGLKVDKGAEAAALTGYLAGRKPPEPASAFAQDGKDKEGGSWVDRQMKKEA